MCNQDYMNDVMLNFFDELDGPSTSPDPTSEPTPAPTDPGTPAPVTVSNFQIDTSYLPMLSHFNSYLTSPQNI